MPRSGECVEIWDSDAIPEASYGIVTKVEPADGSVFQRDFVTVRPRFPVHEIDDADLVPELVQ